MVPFWYIDMDGGTLERGAGGGRGRGYHILRQMLIGWK